MDEKILQILESLQDDVKGIKQDVGGLKQDVGDIKQDIKNIKTTQAEHTQILRVLQHSSEVNKVEHDKMSNEIAHIKGDVEGIKKNLSQIEIVTANNWADIAKLKSVR